MRITLVVAVALTVFIAIFAPRTDLGWYFIIAAASFYLVPLVIHLTPPPFVLTYGCLTMRGRRIPTSGIVQIDIYHTRTYYYRQTGSDRHRHTRRETVDLYDFVIQTTSPKGREVIRGEHRLDPNEAYEIATKLQHRLPRVRVYAHSGWSK